MNTIDKCNASKQYSNIMKQKQKRKNHSSAEKQNTKSNDVFLGLLKYYCLVQKQINTAARGKKSKRSHLSIIFV